MLIHVPQVGVAIVAAPVAVYSNVGWRHGGTEPAPTRPAWLAMAAPGNRNWLFGARSPDWNFHRIWMVQWSPLLRHIDRVVVYRLTGAIVRD